MALVWRKSSRSSGAGGDGNTNDCVEVAFAPAGRLLRDSKTGDRGAILDLTLPAFDALLATIKRAQVP